MHIKRPLISSLLALTCLAATTSLIAQVPAPSTTPSTTAAPATPPQSSWKAQQEHLLLTDFPNLAKYREADLRLGPPAANEQRVVFMGDSITENWGLKGNPAVGDVGDFFPGKPYVNRGISGQTTPQMLVRFRQDVINLKPTVVVLLAGTNDIAGNTGPTTLEAIENNIMSMTELARANNIRVVLCSVLPAIDFKWNPGLAPAQKIRDLNTWIRDYASRNGIVYVDYYTPMATPEGALRPELGLDTVHPNKAGYAIMAPLAEKGIAEALKRPTR